MRLGATLAALGALLVHGAFDESEVGKDVTSQRTCFPEPGRMRKSILDGQNAFGFGTPPNNLKIEIRTWDSHRIVTRMAEILLREKLGFELEVLRFKSGRYVYERLAEQVVHANFECWPGNHKPLPPEGTGAYWKADEVYGCDRGPNGDRCAANVGEIGYSGQSGWFISATALEERGPLLLASVDTGGEVIEKLPLGTEAYSSLMLANFSSWSQRLATAQDLPQAPGRCASFADRGSDDLFADGVFMCDEASGLAQWFVDDGRCCPRAPAASAACSGSGTRPPDCIALVSNHPSGPDFDDLRNRKLIHGSRMPVQIVYAPYVSSIDTLEAAGQPLLFYRWESDSLFVRNFQRFMRVSNTFATRCSTEATLHLSAKEKNLCDFHTNNIHKMASTSLKARGALNSALGSAVSAQRFVPTTSSYAPQHPH